MKSLSKVLFFSLFLVSFCFARGGTAKPYFAPELEPYPVATDTLSDEELAALPPMDWNVDSTQIYHDLVMAEAVNSHTTPNVVGITFGSVFTAAGLTFLGMGIYAMNRDGEGLSKAFDDLAGGLLIFCFATPTLALGIPLLGYNIYAYGKHKDHAVKRDEYLKSDNAYKRRRAAGAPAEKTAEEQGVSLQMSILPTVDVANAGGGMKLMLAF